MLAWIAAVYLIPAVVHADEPPPSIDLVPDPVHEVAHSPKWNRQTRGRDVMLTTALSTTEGVALGLTGLYFSAIAISCAGPDDEDLCLGGALGGLGASALALSSFSFVTLARAVQEGRRRVSGTVDDDRSLHFNRLAIAYDTVFISIPTTVVALSVSSVISEDGKLSRPGRALFGTALVWIGLHAWSLAENVRALRGRKRERRKGPQFAGSGIVW